MSVIVVGVSGMSQFFHRPEQYARILSLSGNEAFVVDFVDIEDFSQDIASSLINTPDEFFKDANEALEGIDIPSAERKDGEKYDISIRIKNLPDYEKVRIKDLRAKQSGRFIRVEGIIRRATKVFPEMKIATFECECGTMISVDQRGRSELMRPAVCDICGRKTPKSFKVVDKVLWNTRRIRLDDLFETTVGEMPGDLVVELREDLVSPEKQNTTDPGSRVMINGIFRLSPKKKNGKTTNEYTMCLEANYIQAIETELEKLEISENDEEVIRKMAADPDIYNRLISSLAPSLYGLESIKEAVVLQLFGGVAKTLEDQTEIRGDIHILLVGDPSSGKSKLIQRVSKVVPRGRYVSGKGVSGVGLTATVMKDEEFGGWVVEAGAIVLANRGIVCIDEFDKVSKDDLVNLHECMSIQIVTIAKATIQTVLPARTSIIAAANPKLSRFDPFKSIAEQINLPDTLLTRFDLKFTIRDVPNKKEDALLMDHIKKTRSGGNNNDIIDRTLLRKYIAYAKQRCSPGLSAEAIEKLRDFYLKMRETSTNSGADGRVAITLRQYEAMERLAEASAKIRLSDRVLLEDADRAIKMMTASMKQLGYDIETGKFDIDKVDGGVPASKRGRIQTVLDVLAEMEKETENVTWEELTEKLSEKGICDPDPLLRDMKHEGIIFEPRHGVLHTL